MAVRCSHMLNLSDLSVPDDRNQLQTGPLRPVSKHQIQISRWIFGQKNNELVLQFNFFSFNKQNNSLAAD